MRLRVTTQDGSKPSAGQFAAREVRYLSGALAVLDLGAGSGLHDRILHTRVVDWAAPDQPGDHSREGTSQ